MTHPSLQSRVTRHDDAVHHGGDRVHPISMVIMHATEGKEDAVACMRYLNTTTDKQACYHYLIDRDGSIHRMWPANKIAYHAGDSAWPKPKTATQSDPMPNRSSVNGISVGVAFCNNGANDGETLTPAQRESALWLVNWICQEQPEPIRCRMVRGHYEVSPGRKVDPRPALDMDDFRGKLFDYMESA